MSRDFLTNKWIIGSFLLLIIIAGGCYFWYQHSLTADRKAAADAAEYARQWEKQKAKAKSNTAETTSTQAPAESNTPQNAEKHITNATVTKETAATHGQTGATAENRETAEVRVSPYGFGPYPEVPEGFIDAVGKPFWLLPDELLRQRRKPPSRNVELMQRVMVKLWKQGRTDVEAAFMDGDKIRVHFKNRAYVRYSTVTTLDGKEVKYISSWRAGNSVSQPQPQPGDAYPPGEQDVSPGVELIDMDEEPGINPYEFLGLN
ncbi:MAG: hypothetical protein OXU23_22500 [Candidatus Poribacteria bacterium]|nr:hypothetical protein [Candidatus Poribacteria bacterium]